MFLIEDTYAHQDWKNNHSKTVLLWNMIIKNNRFNAFYIYFFIYIFIHLFEYI